MTSTRYFEEIVQDKSCHDYFILKNQIVRDVTTNFRGKRLDCFDGHTWTTRLIDLFQHNTKNGKPRLNTISQKKVEKYYISHQSSQITHKEYEYAHRLFSPEVIKDSIYSISEMMPFLDRLHDLEIRFRILNEDQVYRNNFGSFKRRMFRANSLAIAYQLGAQVPVGYFEIFDADLTNLSGIVNEACAEIYKDLSFLKAKHYRGSKECKCIFSPEVTGLFVHECVGHSYEADYYFSHKNHSSIGDAVVPRRLQEYISIVDYGGIRGSGYTPFDDEGTDACKTYIIRRGRVSELLTNSHYARLRHQSVSSGNARGKSIFDPNLIRMTTTYMDKGNQSVEALFGSVDEGIYIETSQGAFLKDKFYLIPRRAYQIRKGRIKEPVSISCVSGRVNELLYSISGISNTVRFRNSLYGGCRKLNQDHLRVAYGGPYLSIDAVTIS